MKNNSFINPFSIISSLPGIYLLTVLSSGAATLEQLRDSKPNIIFIMTDDQGYAPVGANGHPWIQTPNIDKLAAKSLRFDRFHVAPTCAPTRSALMSGRHPMKNGVTHTILERERMALSTVTLPQVLKTAGYTSAIFGKWHLGDEEEYQPHKRGFDETFIHGAGGIGQAYACSCADVPGNKYFDPVIRHNGTFVKTHGYCTDIFFSAAMGWIKKAKDGKKPFFAYISTNAPHGPFNAPEENAARFLKMGFSKKTAGFYGMIENIDDNIGKLMQKLEEWNMFENTVIIFLSDNGMTGGGSGHGKVGQTADGKDLYAWNAGMKGQKGSANEGGTRVPAYFRWDGKIRAGQTIDTIGAHIDILPTLADLAGAELPPNQVEGRSLLPLLSDEEHNWPDRYLFTHCGRWPTGANPDNYKMSGFAVRSQHYRLVGYGKPKRKNRQNPAIALYDMEKDPGQKTNVSAQHPEVVHKMLSAYDTWWKETRPLMVNEDVPISKTHPYQERFRQQKENGGIPDWKPPVL